MPLPGKMLAPFGAGSPAPATSLPPPPTVPAFPAGYSAQAADFTDWITGPLWFSAAGVIFRGQQTTPQSTGAHGTWNPLRLTAVDDVAQGWNAGERLWMPPPGYDGWYTVTIGTNVQAGAALQLEAGIAVSGVLIELADVATFSAVMGGAVGEATVYIAGGVDWIQPMIWSSVETTTDCSTPGRFPFMEIAFEST